jgi:hypothetical protein
VKWHLTSCKIDSDEDRRIKAIEKARAILVSDSNTPILGALAKRTLEQLDAPINGMDAPITKDTGWFAKMCLLDALPGFPNDAAYYDDYCTYIPSNFDYGAFLSWVGTGNVLEAPMFGENPEQTKLPQIIVTNKDE